MSTSDRGKNHRRERNLYERKQIISLSVVLLSVLVVLLSATLYRNAAAGLKTESQKAADRTLVNVESQVNNSVSESLEEKGVGSKASEQTLWQSAALSITETSQQSTEPTIERTTEGTTEQTTEETSEQTTEETTEATTGETTRFLLNLDAYKPGDVIPEDRINKDNLDAYFVSYKISRDGAVFSRINGKSWQDNDNISLSDLRYIQMPHYNFDGNVQLGELIVNVSIEDSIIAIFKELFLNKYQIEKMFLIDNYWVGEGEASDSNSIDHNNTSAFCYRPATGGGSLSKHSYGRAIDINPQQNPYVSYSTGQPKWSHSNANDYIARDTGLAHVITHDDLAYKLFNKYGYTWGGDWTNPKDYQHFVMQ